MSLHDQACRCGEGARTRTWQPGADTSTAVHDATGDESEPLNQTQTSKNRSQVARCLFFSQHQAHIAFIVNELCQRMSNPRQQSLTRLTRFVRHLTRDRQWRQTFACGRMCQEVTTDSDPGWAGDRESRKSSSVGKTHAEGIHT